MGGAEVQGAADRGDAAATARRPEEEAAAEAAAARGGLRRRRRGWPDETGSAAAAAWIDPMEPPRLTRGAVKQLAEHPHGPGTIFPVLQVADVKLVDTKGTPGAQSDRFRMLISDGVHSQQSFLATPLNRLVKDGTLRSGSVVHFQQTMCNIIQNRRIFIVCKLDVLQRECPMIGTPKMYEMIISPDEEEPNLPANAAQTNSGSYSAGKTLPRPQMRLTQNPMEASLATPARIDPMEPPRLTRGAVKQLAQHPHGPGTIFPVVQVADVKLVDTTGARLQQSERFRILLSDGVHSQQSMLATPLNCLVKDGTLRPGSIIHLVETMCNIIQNRRIIIVTKLDVLERECPMIGTPKKYEMKISPDDQEPNLPANAAQTNSGSYSAGKTLPQPQMRLTPNPPPTSLATPAWIDPMEAPWLTKGAVKQLAEHPNGPGTIFPVVQVGDVNLVNTKGAQQQSERFHMLISDGVHLQQSMLTTLLNTLIKDGTLRAGSIVHLAETMCNTIQNRRIIIVCKLDVLQSERPMIGTPKMLDENLT